MIIILCGIRIGNEARAVEMDAFKNSSSLALSYNGVLLQSSQEILYASSMS